MAAHCMHPSRVGVTAHPRVRYHTRLSSHTAVRHQQGCTVQALSKRTCRQSTYRRRLVVLAASSTDQEVRGQSEVTRSAQDLAQGVQDFLDESQKALSSDEPPLPEHPIGEESTIDVADGIDASVSAPQQSCSNNQPLTCTS